MVASQLQPQPQLFTQANPHALATIVDATARCSIVASQDIFDDKGTKLWAKDQPVSHSLQQRLLERRLKQPLESCLRAEDGITVVHLHEMLERALDERRPLAAASLPWSETLRQNVKHLPLHATVQLLLTSINATKPQIFEHAVHGMMLAGAVLASTGAGHYDVRLAMLAGLLHDLGEMYINPAYLDGSRPLDIPGYRHVVTHPRVGEVLLTTLTDYPGVLARAIGEHHERLDGTGYPGRRRHEGLSSLGRLLAAVEVALGIAQAPDTPLRRISLALRLVPGEFDPTWLGFFSSAAHRIEDEAVGNAPDGEGLRTTLAMINSQLDNALEAATELSKQQTAHAAVRDVATAARHILVRLRAGWNAMGLWSAVHADDSIEARREIDLAQRDLRYRLRSVRRECLWPIGDLGEADARKLEPLWQALGISER
jgi:hypothetical protein